MKLALVRSMRHRFPFCGNCEIVVLDFVSRGKSTSFLVSLAVLTVKDFYQTNRNSSEFIWKIFTVNNRLFSSKFQLQFPQLSRVTNFMICSVRSTETNAASQRSYEWIVCIMYNVYKDNFLPMIAQWKHPVLNSFNFDWSRPFSDKNWLSRLTSFNSKLVLANLNWL